jgi:Flp pilus assembly protein TadD
LALDPSFDAARLAFVEAQQGDETTRESSREASLQALETVAPGSAYAQLALIQRAYILRDMGRSDDAIAMAQAADATGDRSAAGTLADLYRGAQRFGEAEAIYDRLIKADPKPNWRLLFARGAMRERSGRWAEAEVDLKAALELAPKQPEVMNYLGFAWADRGERLNEALDMLREAVALSPESGHIVDSLGWAHYRRGEYDLALVHLERAVELEPNNYEVNEHLGDLYWRLNRKREAGFQWTRALSFKPDAASIARLEEKVRIGLPDAPKPAPLARAQ